jgi:pimeloyl-ACP methyl ester carboxylesterase
MDGDGRNVLLVHGAWQGSWSWQRFIPHIEARGWRATAIDLPGNGTDDTPPQAVTLDLYVEHVVAIAERLDGPLTVVGHSGGGVVASQVGEAIPDRIGCLVYLAGMMLPNGIGFADIVGTLIGQQPDAVGIGRHLVWSEGRVTSAIPPEAAIEIFYHDCDAADARWAAERLTHQPERSRSAKPRLSTARYGSIPRIYVEAAFDRSVVPAAQHMMQRLSPGAMRLAIATGHAPQLAQPERLADLLDRAIPQAFRRPPSSHHEKASGHGHPSGQSEGLRS